MTSNITFRAFAVTVLAILAAAVGGRTDGTIVLLDYTGGTIASDGAAEARTLSSDPEWRYIRLP